MIGKTVSHYRILEKLGEGGMGVVYRAEDLDLQVPRALKFLPPHAAASDQDRTRLEREARAAASLEHPNICPVHEIGHADDQTFIVMSYLEGRTLAARLDAEGPLPVHEALTIATQVGSALSRAHAAGVVHRDIKPANIMLTGESPGSQEPTSGLQAVVMDFGLVQAADFTRMTKTGTALGTAAYMSPEQSRGQTIDARTDVWSLGVVLYEMLTGRQPFKGDHLAAVALAVQAEDPDPVTQLRPEVPADLAKVIERALAKDPEQRYQTADELLSDLQAVRDKQELGRKTAQHARRRQLKRRKRLLYGVLAAAVVIAAGILWWSRYQSVRRIDALAVLPFANLSGDSEQEYFADGMTDALITELQQLAADQLRVISRTSIMRYKVTDLTLPEIAAELGVDVLVEASVVRTGEMVKVAAKLIRARPREQQMWADSYERDLKDVLALHAQVARKVAEQVQLVLAPMEKDDRQVDPEAYEEYLLGSHIMNSTGDVGCALPHFERAIAIDSSYAPAWTAAAHCKIMPTHYWPFNAEDVEEARRLAERGIELDPDNAEGFYVLGHILYEHHFEIQEAGKVFERALQLNPSHGLGLLVYAFYAASIGDCKAAVDAAHRALKADPFNFLMVSRVNGPLLSCGRYAEYLAEIQRIKKLQPDRGSDFGMERYYYVRGEYEEAIKILERNFAIDDTASRYPYTNETNYAHDLRELAGYKWCAGEKEEAHELANEWLRRVDPDSVNQISVAEIYAIKGERDSTYAWLERAYEQRDIWVVRLADPRLLSLPLILGDDPLFQQWLQRIGLVN